MFASVTLPAHDAQGLSLETVHMVFARELAQHFDHVISAPVVESWTDEDTGAVQEQAAVCFTVSATPAAWEAKGGRLARRLENLAARYAADCDAPALTVTHCDGSTVYVGALEALARPAPVQGPTRDADPAFLPRQREDKAARFDRLTA
ncbi:hypothetical protein CcrSwift_gp341 [Caulobacter phage CcrSwift]|uniref:Uncharacterized protein n=1 Tax=Caulobacter phage CcrSwift TaxID=2927984 RepID=K4JTH1_9CAUD|nr:hypothetical protein D870_gp016 [Caulobacter phage CcrSwift]YP_006990074.1 hypothetical protein D870_gp080 [Caulobacter phage CcrSwift]AFU88334.1 hypothetical protein CcrSwift_gp016 [Caulobacter phage CcrSwift]AFU88659.1 hypothetical protein CcrSwift_gp341 [Caulobacter phage CcrSwift]